MNRGLLGVGLLGFALSMSAGCGGDSSASPGESRYAPRLQQVEVSVATVRRQPLQAEVEFTGNLLPRRVTRVTSEVDGIVRDVPQVGTQFDVVVQGRRYSERLGISYGQFVKQGDVLVQLDARDAEVALRMAEAKLAKAKADLAKLRSWERPEQVRRLTALRDEAKARHELAVSTHRRMGLLVQRSATTQSDVERAAMDVSTAQAILDAAEAALTQAKAGPTDEEIAVQQALIAQAQAEVEQHTRAVEKTTIRAPYDGVVTAFRVEVGDRVSPGANPVVELMDLRYLVAEVAVPEVFVGRVKVKDEATVTTAGAAAPVPGLVIAVNDMVDPQTRTFHVRVAIDNQQGKFKAGQFAGVHLSLGAKDSETLAVPNPSLVFVDGQPHVFVLNKDRVKTTRVEVGVSNHEATEILSGLEAGDVVVVHDPSLLADGMAVTVKDTTTSHATSPATGRQGRQPLTSFRSAEIGPLPLVARFLPEKQDSARLQ